MRPSVDQWFLGLAKAAASRSTCPRASVGCVLALGNELLAVGFNGMPSGRQHCTDVGCVIGPSGGCMAAHAEVNALKRAERWRMPLDAATAYVTLSPCTECFKALRSAGIWRIVYSEAYRITSHLDGHCEHIPTYDLDVHVGPRHR